GCGLPRWLPRRAAARGLFGKRAATLSPRLRSAPVKTRLLDKRIGYLAAIGGIGAVTGLLKVFGSEQRHGTTVAVSVLLVVVVADCVVDCDRLGQPSGNCSVTVGNALLQLLFPAAGGHVYDCHAG